MRKIIAQTVVSLDGYFEGPNQSIDWHGIDDDYRRYAAELLRSVDAILFGRVTYQLMEKYWPTTEAISRDPLIANLMNQLQKYVFSNSLERADWHNTSLVKGDPIEAIRNLKQQNGKDMVILGRGTVVADLTRYGLIEEYQLMVNPVLLGQGSSLFKGLQDRVDLKLERSNVFPSGNVLLCYRHNK